MAMIRHVLSDNHWELKCPECGQFVAIDVAIMNGRAPFPQHAIPSDETYSPMCSYRETYNWRADMPPTGVSALGPLEA